MLRSLHIKLVLIMILLVVCLMTIAGAFLVNSVNRFYLNEFYTQMVEVFSQDTEFIRDLVTAREGVTLEEAKEILRRHKIEKLPIVDEEYHLKGLITIKDIEKATVYPNSARDEKGRLLVGAAIGATPDVLDRVHALVEAGVDVLCLDSAHGHSNNILECVRRIKALYPDVQIIAGNFE